MTDIQQCFVLWCQDVTLGIFDCMKVCTRYAAKTLRPAGLETRDRGKYAYMAWNELHVKDILTFWGAWQLGCIVADSGMQQNKSTYQRV